MQNRITIDPSVALMELTIDANYSRDRRLFLANELHLTRSELEATRSNLDATQQENNRLNEMIAALKGQGTEPAVDSSERVTQEVDQ